MFRVILFLCFFASANNFKKEKEQLEQAISMMQNALMLVRSVRNSFLESEEIDFKLYKKGIKALESEEFEKARAFLLPFSKRKGELAVKALYWIAFSFFSQKNYEKALVSFTHFSNRLDETSNTFEFNEMKKDSKKKTAICFASTKRTNDACSLAEQIKSEFPEERDFAENLLKRLNCQIGNGQKDVED